MSSTGPLSESLAVLLWMACPVLGGYLLWRLWLGRRVEGERTAAFLARVLGRTAILGSATPLMAVVFWGAPLPSGRTLVLPLVGLAVHGAGALFGWAAGGPLALSPRSRGALLLGGASSNVLTFGGVTVILLLRSAADPYAELALGEMALYRVFEAPFYFLVAWPLAAMVGGTNEGASGWIGAFRKAFQGVTLAPLAGIGLGWALNFAGWTRPPALDGVSEVLVKTNIVLLGASVGLSLRRASPLRHAGSCAAVSTIKFALMPAVGVGLAWALGFTGLTLQVIAISASMPVAFMAVVGTTLYRLDEELAGSLWLFTTGAMAVVVPFLAWVVPEVARI